MSVGQRNGRWFSRFEKGRWVEQPDKTIRYFGRGNEAERKAREFDASLPDRRKKERSGGLSFSDLADSYLASKISSMSETDQDNTYLKLENIISPQIGHYLASAINHKRLDEYVASRLRDTVKISIGKGKKKDTGRPISKSTVHRELSIIRAILNWGVSRGLLISSPMAGFQMPKRDDKKILPPTQEDYDKILKHAAPHCKRMILISYYTGLRPGREAYDLRWENVDREGRTITIISAKKGGIPARVVPVHDTLLEYLHQWWEEDKKKPGYLIHWNGKQIKTSMKKAWAAAKRRAGITWPLRPYSLRHKTISDMLSAGADVGAVAEIVGHSDPNMTLKVYQETNTAIKNKAIKGLR